MDVHRSRQRAPAADERSHLKTSNWLFLVSLVAAGLPTWACEYYMPDGPFWVYLIFYTICAGSIYGGMLAAARDAKIVDK